MSLNSDTRQNIQSNLDFSPSPTGEAQKAGREGSESLRATSVPESPAGTDRTMEEIVERENLKDAFPAPARSAWTGGHMQVSGSSVHPVQVQPEHGHPAVGVAALLLHSRVEAWVEYR